MADEPIAPDKSPASADTPGLPEQEESLSVGKIALQFFVIPMLIVAFCVAIVFLFRWLTYEQRHIEDYIGMLKQSSSPSERGQAAKGLFDELITYIPEAKRWQGIYDLTQQLTADKEKFLREHPGFSDQVIQIFEDSQGDPKVRRYLALTLGIVGDAKATAALSKAAAGNDSDTAIAALIALGGIGDSAALPVIEQAAHSDDAGVRQAAVYALGSFHNDEVTRALDAALNDPDELVTWNAAFALARQGSLAGEKVLTRLLDFEYVSKRGSLSVSQRQQYRVAAIQQLARLKAPGVVSRLETLSASDPDMPVRQAAIEGMKQLKQ